MQKYRNDKKELFNDQPFQGGYDFLFIESPSPCQIFSRKMERIEIYIGRSPEVQRC